jgi:hypothetical protein
VDTFAAARLPHSYCCREIRAGDQGVQHPAALKTELPRSRRANSQRLFDSAASRSTFTAGWLADVIHYTQRVLERQEACLDELSAGLWRYDDAKRNGKGKERVLAPDELVLD